MKIRIFAVMILCLAFVSAKAQNIDRSKMPAPGPAPQINLGIPNTFELKNGLKVLVVENHKLPRVSASLTIDNKPYAMGDKVGVESLYSMMMGNGTDNMDKDSFNGRIDYLGARVGYGSQSASAGSLTKYFPEVFGLMADGLLNPFFSETEFQDQKKRMIEGIKSVANSVDAVAGDVRGALVYGKNHPFGEFATEEAIERLTLNDVKNYYENFITPKNAYLVVVGDIKTAQVRALVGEHFEKWTSSTPPVAELPQVQDALFTQVNFVDMPNAVQSEVAVMNVVHLKKTDPDYFPALIANQILGGGGDARLFNNLREDKSYTYGAYSSLGNSKYVSSFRASASVRNEVTDSAVVAFFDEIYRIREEKVSRQELELAKAKYTGNFVMALESPSTIARYALAVETDNLPDNFYHNFLKNIDAVTIDDVQRVAQKYIRPENARIVIVGKGSEVAKGLENLEYRGKKIPVRYYDKEANPIEKPEYNKEVSADVTVASVYDAYINAIGGKNTVNGVNSVYAKFTGSMGPQSLDMVMKMTKDKVATEVGMSGMVLQKQIFNGKAGYIEAQGQKMDMSDEDIEAMKHEVLFSELTVNKDAEVTGIENVNGEDAYVIKYNENITDYYSVASGLKLQTIQKTPMGNSVTAYSDYKEIKGVKLPHAVSQSFGPQSIEFKAEDVKVNEGISDADFN